MWMLLVLLSPTWLWVSPDTGPWRVPMGARAIEQANDSELAVMTRTELVIVDRKTGIAEPAVKVIDDGWMHAMANVRGKLIAFGELNNAPAAWEITMSPPTATPLQLDDPGGAAPGYGNGMGVQLSLDGSKVLVCGNIRPPTVRDATTLAVIATAPGVSCDRAYWTDANHVVLGSHKGMHSLDLGNGQVTPLSFDVVTMEGRRGLVWRGDKDGYQISDKKGPIRQHLDWSVGSAETRWTPDGSYVVAQSFNHVRIIPTKRGANDIDIEVPYGVASFAVDHKFATVLIGNAILDIELATGIVRQPDGNLSHVGGIAPRNGQLITIADKLRVWRDGKVDRTLGDANELAGGDGTSPIALLDGGAAFWWDPDTDARESVSGSRWLSEIYRAGNDLVLVSIDELFRVGPAGATRWMTLEGRIDSVDVKRGRIMLHHNDRTYVLDTKTKSAWSFVVADGLGSCDAALEVAFSPDGTRVAAYSDGGLVLFEAKNGKPIGRIELTDLPVVHWSFLPNGDLVIAGVQELVIWNAKTKTASGYMTTVDMMPTQIAVDTAGKELGVAYIDGRVLWADVAALRSNATVRPSTFTKVAACTSDKDKDKPAIKPLRYDALVKPPSD